MNTTGFHGYQGVTLVAGDQPLAAVTAERLLAQGQRVAVTGCDDRKRWNLAEALGLPSGLLAVPGHEGEEMTVDRALERFGRLDAVVVQAGRPDSAWLVRSALPALAASCGRLVLVGSGPEAEDIRAEATAAGVALTVLDTDRLDACYTARAVLWVLNQPAQVTVEGLTLRPSGGATPSPAR